MFPITYFNFTIDFMGPIVKVQGVGSVGYEKVSIRHK